MLSLVFDELSIINYLLRGSSEDLLYSPCLQVGGGMEWEGGGGGGGRGKKKGEFSTNTSMWCLA